MVASLRGSGGTGTKEDESSTGRVWAAGFHHVTARSRLARVLELMKCLFLEFSKFFSGRGKPWILNPPIRGSAICMYVCVCVCVCIYIYIYIYKPFGPWRHVSIL